MRSVVICHKFLYIQQRLSSNCANKTFLSSDLLFCLYPIDHQRNRHKVVVTRRERQTLEVI